MTLLTPLGALVGLLALLPIAAALIGHRRVDTVRRTLRLPSPERRAELLTPTLAAIGIVLLGVAAAQPALTRNTSPSVRRDAQALFVLDTSRSMAASATPSGRTRLDRAAAAAVQLRAAIPQVESGVLTLTDRVLPDLLPVADVEGFDGVVRHAVRIESPPPRATSLRATSYDVLGDIAAGNDFAPGASRRIVVLLTDGESNPVQAGDLATRLAVARGYRFVAIRFWRSNESVFGADGKRESAYRPDPGGQATIHELVAALDGRSFEEGQLSAASAYLQRVAGSGPSVRVAGVDTRRVPLAPYAALAGLLALILAVRFSRLAPRGLRLIRQ